MLKASILVFALFAIGIVAAMSRPGGLGDVKPANDELRDIVSSVSKLMESKYPTSFTTIEPVSYRTQVVQGLNYFVEALVTEKESKRKRLIHMRIYKPIHGANQLTAIRLDVDEDTPLEHFW